jgi:rhamnogalacturonyl hydrolase YesR
MPSVSSNGVAPVALRPVSQDFIVAKDATLKLLSYCQSRNWAGYDPYDALNSRIFEALPFLNSRLPRLVLTQTLKRCPINLRPLFLIPCTQNPKGLALFVQSALKLSKLDLIQDGDEIAKALAERIQLLRSPDISFWCWGYSFPWQTRTQLVPARSPNLVCTLFVAEALLDLYESTSDERYLDIAGSAADYIVQELYWESETVCSFSYPFPSSRTPVHNANLLAAAFLCRVSRLTGKEHYLKPALAAALYSVRQQRIDGSWVYGESPKYGWVDNFHTGYNLCALRSIARNLQTGRFDESLRTGSEFYRNHFFRQDGAPNYFHNRTYPIDVHCVAQSIITLLELKDLHPENVTLAKRIFSWALANLWNDDEGYFYHQKLPLGTIKIPYMRWGQAWMLLASSQLLEQGLPKPCPEGTHDNSPTFQSWVDGSRAQSPEGTAELDTTHVQS